MAFSVPANGVGKGSFGTAASSLSVSFPSSHATAAGSIILVAGMFLDNGSNVVTLSGTPAGIGAVTDSGLGLIHDTGLTEYSFVKAFFSPAAGITTVTATFSGGANPTFADMFIWEVAGGTNVVFDKFGSAAGTGTAASSGLVPSSGTLSSATEFAIGYGQTSNAYSAGSGLQANWVDDGITTTTADSGQHLIISSTAAITATYNDLGGATSWRMSVATIMSGAVTPPPVSMPLGILGYVDNEW